MNQEEHVIYTVLWGIKHNSKQYPIDNTSIPNVLIHSIIVPIQSIFISEFVTQINNTSNKLLNCNQEFLD